MDSKATRNRDMTDQKQSQESLRYSTEELQRVLAAVSDCLWSAEIDEHGEWHYRYYSPAAEKITGRPTSFFLNEPAGWFGITHPDDRPRVVSAAQRLANGLSEHEEGEYRIARPDGEVRWVRDSAVATRAGEAIRIDGVVSDITARKRAEEELRESENRYRTYLNSATDAFFVYDWQGRLVDVNREACVTLGYAREELIGKEVLDIVVRDESVETDIRPRLEAGETMFFESQYRRKDGSVFSVDVRIRPFQQAGVRFALVSARDTTQRKRAEEELRQAETRFRSFVDHASDLFLVHDQQGRILDANREAWESLGYTREEIIGMHPNDFDRGPVTPPTPVTKARLEAGETVTFESELLRKDGSTFPVEWRIRQYQHGENWFALSSARDISERKRAEEELRQAETRFRTFVDHATDAFFVMDVDTGAILDVNRRACENLGYTREELIGKTLLFFDVDLTIEWIKQNLRPRTEAGENVTFETHHRRKDGIVFPVEVRSRRFEYGGQAVVLSLALDITERRRAENELRASESRFRTLVDHATDAFFLRSDDGKLLDVNKQACESLGYTREALLEMIVEDFDPKVDEALLKWIYERLDAGEVFAFESLHRRKNGTMFPVEVRVRPFWQDGRRLSLSLVRDISERKRAEEERVRLRELEAELTHMNRVSMMGEMTASIAHEINQPLSGVVTNGSACLRWLEGDSPNLGEAREAATRIVRDGKRAGEVIARIRRLATRADVLKEKLTLNETILEVLAIIEDETKKKRVSIQTQIDNNLSPVFADRVQLQQVVLNLVMNAVEAMNAVDERARELVIRASNIDADRVMVAVQDVGVGLDSETMARIFDPFYTTKSGGMGMGLAISRSIVRSHGGQLWAAPNQGPGTTFFFDLPRYREEGCNAGTDKA